MSQLQVLKQGLGETRIVPSEPLSADALGENELIVEVNEFSFTANNITYGVAGDMLGYWQFFPALDNGDDQWGIIPVWGFATVTASSCAGVEVGERLFGYFPTDNQLKMSNVILKGDKLIDGAEHRAKLPQGYNTYTRVNLEHGYMPAFDNERMLLWPLHVTSFSLWDCLVMNEWYGADQVLVLSASSKTSLGLGFAIHLDKDAKPSVGVTSGGNQAWVESLGMYDEVVNYDDVENLDASKKVAIVDMSGNIGLLNKLNDHYGDNLMHCLNVGITHRDQAGHHTDIPEGRKTFFFAPGHIQQRMSDWGPEEFFKRSGAFLQKSIADSKRWMKVRDLNGLEDLKEQFQAVADGKVSPEYGLIVRMP